MRTVETMRDFFGDLHCHCRSFDLVLVAMTTPDARMEVRGHLVRCIGCSESFHDDESEPRGLPDDGPAPVAA